MMERLRLSNQTIVAVGLVLGLLGALATYSIALVARDGELIINSDPTTNEIVVEIRGQITTPGVYRLGEDARVADVIAAAGGTLPDADLAQVNLARRLDDAELIVIPGMGAATPIMAGTPAPAQQPASLSFRININTASQPELESLPGIGPVIAARILEYRQVNGPFTSTSELAKVDGVSDSLLSEIENLITAGP